MRAKFLNPANFCCVRYGNCGHHSIRASNSTSQHYLQIYGQRRHWPYTWSLASGSVGNIDQDGTYHAPTTLQAKNNLDGCPLLPNDDILNTPINNLPTSTISDNYMQNIVGMPEYGKLDYAVGHDHNLIDNTAPSVNISSQVNALNNGSYQVPVWPNLQKQQGALVSQNPIVGDQHYWMINHQTCHIGEIYVLDSAGKYIAPDNAIDATQFDSTSYDLPPGSSDSAAGVQLFPLTLRLSDLLSAPLIILFG